MHIQDEAPPLNPWPFLAGDAVLLTTAFLISWQADAPLAGLPLVSVTVCVGLGAILAVIPFVLNHTRKQDLALADRQREIAALAQTTANSAEQISIAASNLHTIVEHAARALKLGDSLPHKMQEKINEFKAQLNEVAVTENEALAQEINTLRAGETERLESALTGVRKASAELASLEAATHKHVKELNESLTRFTAEAGKSATSAVKSIDEARVNAEKTFALAQAAAVTGLQKAVEAAIATLEDRFSSFAEKTAEHPTSSKKTADSDQPSDPTKSATGAPSDPAASKPANKPPVETQTSTSAPPSESSNIKSATSRPPIVIADKPATRPPFAPDASAHSSHTSQHPMASTTAQPLADTPATSNGSTTLLAEEKPARKRLSRKPAVDENEFTLGLDLHESEGEFSQISPPDNTPAVSADGLTRLIVTAYIGIGNKLYARGEGPGLSWDHGVPLQFVSIGKWRWESADATAPVQLKLYKNDALECAAVGLLTIAPGHQHEVTASFN